MTIRETLEQEEFSRLAPWAAKAAETKGRIRQEEENEVRTCYQRDVDRIVYSKSFRRLKHKTQVFLQPEGDHYRTRLTHTLEVMRISRTIARALQLNEDLTEAIAYGHDLGHTPFGHAGEKALSEIIRTELKDPRIHPMTSVVLVKVTPDLKYCKAYISVLAGEEQARDTIQGLKSAEGFIRTRLAKMVNLRNTPEVSFVLDQSIEYGVRMSRLIDEVAEEDAKKGKESQERSQTDGNS